MTSGEVHTEPIDVSRVTLRFDTQTSLDRIDEEDTDGLCFWSIRIELLDDERNGVERLLGTARAVVVEAMCPDPLDACDASSADLQGLAAVVWTTDGDLTQEAEEVIEDTGLDVLLLDRIELDPDVRGQGLGLLCAAELIRVLGRGCSAVATQGMPSSSRELTDTERRRGSTSLVRHWRQLGLEPVPGHEDEGMLIGDLTRTRVADARIAIRADVGLR